MRTASFVWCSHPEKPMVNLCWEYNRETGEYRILQIDLGTTKICENKVFRFDQDLIYKGGRSSIKIYWKGSDLYLNLSGFTYHFRYRPSYIDLIESIRGNGVVKAQMPGKILKVDCKLGNLVKEGDQLLIMESMKMENKILAPRNGKVQELLVGNNELVEADQLLVVIEGSDD